MPRLRSLRRLPIGAVLMLATALVAVPASSARAVTVHVVAPGGSDSAPGTLEQPWSTVSHALEQIGPGNTLYLREGTYVERINETVSPGTASAPVIVAAYPGERPVIKGLLRVTGASYWTLDGINVTWDPVTGQPGEHMVKMINGIGWTFKNAELWGARSYAALLVASTVPGEPSGWTVTSNCIHDTQPTNGTNQDQLIYANSGVASGGGVIEHNLLFNATNGMGVKLGGPSSSSGGAANVVVRHNTIYNTAQSILVAWQSHHNELHRNLMVRVGENYGNIRGYQLSGVGNVAWGNAGGEAKQAILNDPGYTGVKDGGGNLFPVDPQFDGVAGCDGFHPANPIAQAFGRYGTGSGGDGDDGEDGGSGGGSIITLRGASAGSNGTASSLMISAPTGVVFGDLLIASIDVRGRTAVTPPAGWILVRKTKNGNIMSKSTYYRVAGPSERSYTWRFPRKEAAAGGIVAYDGADAAAPIAASSGGLTRLQSVSIWSPSVTAAGGGDVVVGFFATATGTTIHEPVGMTERWDLASTAGMYKVTSMVADFAPQTAGPTGDKVATAIHAAPNIGHLVALNPA